MMIAPTNAPRLSVVIILLSLLLFTSCSQSNEGDNESIDDDNTPILDDDDSGDTDDDSNSDDDDTWQPPPCPGLPTYVGDGHLHGIICGPDTLIMQDDGWTPVTAPVSYFNYCRSVDADSYVLLQTRSPSEDLVYLYANGAWRDLQFSGSLGEHVMLPLVFFNDDSGFAGNFLYENGYFQRVQELFYADPIAPDDAVFVDVHRECILRWQGVGVQSPISCIEDIPGEFTPPLPGMDLGIIDLKYFDVDNIWVALAYDVGVVSAYLTVHFAHWNGSWWDSVYDAPPVSWTDQYGQVNMKWDYASEDKGWAILNCYDPFCRYNGILLEYSDGIWAEVEKPQITPPDVVSPQCADVATDLCNNLSAASEEEVWLTCARYRTNSNTGQYQSCPYFLQINSEGYGLWDLEGFETGDDMDVRANESFSVSE